MQNINMPWSFTLVFHTCFCWWYTC